MGRGDRGRGKGILFALVALFLTLLTLELVSCAGFLLMPGQEELRSILAGETAYVESERHAIGQAYLLYVPSPGFSDEHGPQHNEHGYRGDLVPLRRTPGVQRVLCLGGSTTYGSVVKRADQTWPAQLQRLLHERGFESAEVINAGVRWASTAELLTHYHFKWHYYRPDLVIINTGGNDAGAFRRAYYHPDYSHWRRHPRHPRELDSPLARGLLRSRLISLLVVPVFFGDEVRVSGFAHEGAPPIQWYSYPGQSSSGASVFRVPEYDIAFRHNLEVLVDAIRRDGSSVLLVPFRETPKAVLERIGETSYPRTFRVAIEKNEAILRDLGSRESIPVAPFPADSISTENWVDRCHVNEEGSGEKALHIVAYAASLLETTDRSREGQE